MTRIVPSGTFLFPSYSLYFLSIVQEIHAGVFLLKKSGVYGGMAFFESEAFGPNPVSFGLWKNLNISTTL